MKRVLQVTLVLASSAPLVIGLSGFVDGAAGFIPVEDAPLALDAHLRALSIWFTLTFFLSIWCARNLERAGPILYTMFAVMASAGFARLYSMFSLGESEARVIIAASVEIATIVFIPWHWAYLRSLGHTGPIGPSELSP